MSKAPTLPGLLTGLAQGKIIPLPEKAWGQLAGGFELVEEIPTGMAGPILLVRWPEPGSKRKGWAIVEQSRPDERVVRPLPDQKEARALIADRLAAYERMWDG